MSGATGWQESAEALLRASWRVVLLRMPGAAVSGDEAEQMGLVAAEFEDVALMPCVFRKAGERNDLLVSAVAVAKVVGSLAFDSAAELFARAVGVVVDAELLRIDTMTPVEVDGAAICYRVRLVPAQV
jgi:hypothetical protein